MRALLIVLAAAIAVFAGTIATGLRTLPIQQMNSITCQSGCINPGHPLSTGLVSFFAANTNWAFGLADLSGHGTGIFSLGAVTFLASPYGGAVGGFVHNSAQFNSNTSEVQKWLPVGSSARTFAILYRMTSTVFATYAPLLFTGNCGTTGQAFEVGVDNSGVVCSNCVWVADNGYGDFVTLTADLKWHVAFGVFPGTSTNATDLRAYLDGRRPGPSTVGSNNTLNTNNNGNGIIMGDSAGACTGVATNAQIAAAWIWSRALTVPEMQLLAADPFGMMYYPRLRVAQPALGNPKNMPPVVY